MSPLAIASDATTANSNSAASLACNKPPGVRDGELLVCAGFFRNSGGTVTPAAGWTQLGPLNTTNETFGMWWKKITDASGEAANYTFATSAGAGRLVLAIFRVQGIDFLDPEDAAGTAATFVGTTSVVNPAVTAVKTGALLLSLVIDNTTTGTAALFTAPGSMTEVVQATNNTGAATSTLQVAQEVVASGSTGTRTHTISPSAANSGGFAVTLTPSSGPPPPPGIRRYRHLLVR